MIFALHYILMNAGLSAILIMLPIFIQKYSDASLTEIGALLMILPFISIIIKPVCCALADRQQAHKKYLIISLTFMMLGYGSMVIPPFFKEFHEEHPRLIWYLYVLGVLIGFNAFGVVWSLGDALAVNAARLQGISWGSYRAWATFSWGLFGFFVGQVNETPLLPQYVPAFFVLICALSTEIFLVSIWPSAYFDMSLDVYPTSQEYKNRIKQGGDGRPPPKKAIEQQQQHKSRGDDLEMNEINWASNRSHSGTLSGSARLNPRLMAALANGLMEEVGSSIKSSLRGGPAKKRTALADILDEHQFSSQINNQNNNNQNNNNSNNLSPTILSTSQQQQPANGQAQAQQQQQQVNGAGSPTTGAAAPVGNQHGQMTINEGDIMMNMHPNVNKTSTFGKSALARTQRALSRMNSLSSASGHAIADELTQADLTASGDNLPRQQMMIMSSLASNASLSRAAAARALGFSQGTLDSTGGGGGLEMIGDESIGGEKIISPAVAGNRKSVEDLQLVLLKLIIKRDAGIIKYLIMFTLYGILIIIHFNYFFMHVEKLCREKEYDFSTVMGAMIVCQAISEIFTFLIVVPYYTPWVGRMGTMLSIAVVFATRYGFYGTYYPDMSPYSALPTEFCHGLAYAMIYSLITEISLDCVNQIDKYLPELIQRGLVDKAIDPNELKLPLRATMQGVFSGAFDGLGNGIGSLFAGVYLDYYSSYTGLWLLCTYLSVAILALYPFTEWGSICGGGGKSGSKEKSFGGDENGNNRKKLQPQPQQTKY